jgi:hypothetical protein
MEIIFILGICLLLNLKSEGENGKLEGSKVKGRKF